MKEQAHILLTGATGFLGSRLLSAMLAADHRVSVLKRSFSDTRRIQHLLPRVAAFDLDHRPLDAVFDHRPVDIIVHTATIYGRKVAERSGIVEANIAFPVRLLDRAESSGVSLFMNIDTLLPGHLNPYALSKHQFVEWLRCGQGATRIVNSKIEFMYGGGQGADQFFPWLMKRFCDGEETIPLTDGHQRRDFIHVDDVVRALLLILRKREGLCPFTEFELGTGEATPVRDAVMLLKERIEQAMGRSLACKLDFGALPLRGMEPMELKADTTQMADLGWRAKIRLEEGIERTVRDYLSGCESRGEQNGACVH
jgi:CDP-paratose synthetase